jgi:threonine dehydrogenase-like Zn-dependent dehydrogenase
MLQEGRLPRDDIVTHRMPLERFQDGIDAVAAGLTSVKVTLEP